MAIYLHLFHFSFTPPCSVLSARILSLTLDICFHLRSSPWTTTITERHLWTLSKCDGNRFHFKGFCFYHTAAERLCVLLLKTGSRNFGSFLMTAGIILRAQWASEREARKVNFHTDLLWLQLFGNLWLFGDRRKPSERNAGGKTLLQTHSEHFSFKLEHSWAFIWFSL